MRTTGTLFPNAKRTLILASAGAGKTERLMSILGEHLVTMESSRISFVTFTRKGVAEGVSRVLKKYTFLTYEQLPFFRTLHSLCFNALDIDYKNLWGIRHEKLLNASIGSNVHRFYDEEHSTRDNQILDAYDIERSGGRADPYITCSPEYARLVSAYERVKEETGAIDFTDCLKLFVEKGKPLPVDVACIDECQDLTDLQWDVCNIAFANASKVYCAGDDFQCQRKDDKVLTRNGYKQIQDITDKDCLISFDVKHQEFKGFQAADYHPQVAKRPFKGELITVTSEEKETASFTPEHKLLVRFDYSNTNIRCVYLMKKGSWYRIGQCQIFNLQGTLHLGTRMRQEQAESCWILRVCTTYQEAREWEAVYSYKFGIPQMSWKFWKNAGDIDRVYNSLPDLISNVEKLLDSVGKYIEFPLLTDERLKARKRGTPLTLCEAVNLCPEIMKLPVYNSGDKTVAWQSFSVGKSFYNDFVYSMNVPVHHTYITNGGIVSHNCVFSYAGANPQVLIDLAKVSKVEKLEISHRLPVTVYNLARKITSNIEVKIDKDCRPKEDAKKGTIKFLPDLFSLYPFIKGKAEENWYILTRNTSFQKDIISFLEGLILPYIANDRYFIPAVDWKKLKDFYLFKKEGYKTEEKKVSFMQENGIKNINCALIETTLFPPAKNTLYQAYVDTYGWEKIEEWYEKKTGIVVSNIHRVKGGEADNVVVVLDCGKKVAEHAFDVPDDELRTLYVAVTRAKENLFFIRSQSNDALDKLLTRCINS